jgi:hypothetical protein
MKKYVLAAAGFLFCGAFLYAELTKAQLWAISLPGILTEARTGYRNSLNDMAMNESGRNSVLTTMRRDWDITTREELFETLDSLENGGHPAALKEIKEIINLVIRFGNTETALRAILDSVQWDRVKWNRFRYVYNNWDKFWDITLKGWDLGRSVALCRWGYNAGFMTEDEAWQRIFHIARMAQQNFSSWEEYGYDYFMGRLFWASSYGEEEKYLLETEPIYNKLLNSYWGWLDWDVDLDAGEKSVPIISRRFLPPDDNDGILQFLTNDPAMYNRYYWHTVPNPNLNIDPVVYEIKVKKISGNDDYGYGMVFCADGFENSNPDFYRFFITVNGRFTVQKRVGNSFTTAPVSWRNSPFLKTGFGVYNTLRVERSSYEKGATFRVFINGSPAVIFNDFTPLNGENFGPVVSLNIMEREQFPHIPADVRFDY